jgi:hypothetical protein
MNIYRPYTYLIGWPHLNKYYYGVRYAKKCNPSDLWISYFTSSKIVKQLRKEHGEPNIKEIRKTFDDPQSARLWEYKVLKRLNCVKDPKWLNQSNTGETFFCIEQTPEHIANAAAAKRGKKLTPEHCANIAAAMTGKKQTLEHIAKRVEVNRGKKLTPEQSQAQSERQRGKKRGPQSPEQKQARSIWQTGKKRGSYRPRSPKLLQIR